MLLDVFRNPPSSTDSMPAALLSFADVCGRQVATCMTRFRLPAFADQRLLSYPPCAPFIKSRQHVALPFGGTVESLIRINSAQRTQEVLLDSANLEVEMPALKAGDVVPDFELPACTGKQKHKFKLSDLLGKKNIVLAFYPLDWSPT
jgi:AhpC/TSA family protein